MKKKIISLASFAMILMGTTVVEADTLTMNVGDIVCFGRYEQDNDLTNGEEPIEWRVMDIQDGKALLLGEYGLKPSGYFDDLADTDWERSVIRKWLNEDFYDSAFDDDEKGKIVETVIHTEDNANYHSSGGNDTSDYVFLLSIEEVSEYFGLDLYTEDKQAHDELLLKATDYAVEQGAIRVTEEGLQYFDQLSEKHIGCCAWWLRSPGESSEYAAVISYDGSANIKGYSVTWDWVIRPAMWIE